MCGVNWLHVWSGSAQRYMHCTRKLHCVHEHWEKNISTLSILVASFAFRLRVWPFAKHQIAWCVLVSQQRKNFHQQINWAMIVKRMFACFFLSFHFYLWANNVHAIFYVDFSEKQTKRKVPNVNMSFPFLSGFPTLFVRDNGLSAWKICMKFI